MLATLPSPSDRGHQHLSRKYDIHTMCACMYTLGETPIASREQPLEGWSDDCYMKHRQANNADLMLCNDQRRQTTCMNVCPKSSEGTLQCDRGKPFDRWMTQEALMRHQSFGHLKPHTPTNILKQTLTKQLCCMSKEMIVLPALLSPAILVTGLLSPRCHACVLLLSLLHLSYVGFPFNCLHKCLPPATWTLVPASRQSLVDLSEVLLALLG